MRPLHGLILACLLLIVGAGAWWLVQTGTAPLAEAAPAVAAKLAPKTSPARSLELPPALQAETEEQPASAREPNLLQASEAARGTERDEKTSSDEPAIRGRVVDSSGSPIADAEILAASRGFLGLPLDTEIAARLGGEEVFRGRSDSAGLFELRGPSPGPLRLAVRSSGYAPLDRDGLALPAGGDLLLGDVPLEPSAILSGHVLDSSGRAVPAARIYRIDPHEDARVAVFNASMKNGALLGESGADGSFRIDQLSAGAWRLLFAHADHPDRIERGATEHIGEEVAGLRVVLEDGVEIQGALRGIPEDLAGEITVRARPTSAGNGHLAGVFISGPGGEARTSPVEGNGKDKGRFTIAGLRPNTSYTLVAQLGTGPFGGPFGRSCSAPVQAQAGARGVDLFFQHESALVFQVVDAQTREPITELEVEAGANWPAPLVDENGRRVATFPEGKVRYGNLRPPRDPQSAPDGIELRVRAVGYQSLERKNIVLEEGRDLDLGVLALSRAPMLRVTLRDASTGEPVEGARLRLSPQSGDEDSFFFEVEDENDNLRFGGTESSRATSDDQGLALLTSFEGVLCRLDVQHPEYARLRRSDVFTAPGETMDLELALGRGGSVLVTLQRDDGTPVAGSEVEHRGVGDDLRGMPLRIHGAPSLVTDAEGHLLFEHLVPGTHSFRPPEKGGSGWIGGNVVVHRRIEGVEEIEDSSWRTIEVAEGGKHELVLIAPSERLVGGKVREGGVALQGAVLRLIPKGSEEAQALAVAGMGGEEVRSGVGGRYAFENVSEGEYTLRVSHESRAMPASFELTVRERDLDFDVELSVAILEGRVVDDLGRPASGVRVFAERAISQAGPVRRVQVRSMFVMSTGDGGDTTTMTMGDSRVEARTDEDGRFTLRGVEPDVDLAVKCEAEGYQEGTSEVVRVAPDQTRRGVDIELEPAGSLEIKARRADGSSGQFLVVTARRSGEQGDGTVKNSFIGETGSTVLDGLGSGTWSVTLRAVGPAARDQEPIPEKSVDVSVGERAVLVFDVP